MTFIFRCIFTFLILHQGIAATIVEERNEVRLAKIELALEDKEFKLALKLIKKNLDSGILHIPTYLLLAQLHMDKGKYSKAMRVYYYVIKKVHPIDGKKIILQKSEYRLNNLLKNISVPTKKALEVYMQVGKTFYSIAEGFENNKVFQKQLYLHAEKFFKVCDRFRFDLATSKFFIGLINTKIERNLEAISNFYNAKELLIEGNADPNEIKNVNYLLADSLIREGRTDAGIIYLKSITRDKDAESSLREYADLYLSGVNTSYSAISFGMDYIYSSNINSLSDQDLEALGPSVYKTKAGSSVDRKLRLVYSSGKIGNFSYRTSMNLNDQETSNRELVRLDERNFGGNISMKYDNFIKSIFTTELGYAQEYHPIDTESGHKKYSTTTNLSFQYFHNLKSGTLGYKVPLQYVNYEFEEGARLTKGINLTFSPFWNTNLFSPSYSANLTSVDEGEASSSSLKYSLSLSNYSTITKNFNIFTYLAITKSTNVDPDLAYTDLNLSLYLTYNIRYISGLSLDGEMSQTLTTTESSKSTKIFESSLGLTYSF